jgi:hypothetical protein
LNVAPILPALRFAQGRLLAACHAGALRRLGSALNVPRDERSTNSKTCSNSNANSAQADPTARAVAA